MFPSKVIALKLQKTMSQPVSSSDVAPPPQAIHHEQRTAQNSCAYLLPTLTSKALVNPALKILDVGAGSGTISITLAQHIPKGQVKATDVNPLILPRAEALAVSAGVANISFQVADAYKLPFSDESFDVTHCHQVLCHLENPWEVLGEMLRVTKTGGIVAVREGDYRSEAVWPEMEALVKFHELVVGMMEGGGGSSTAGRELVSWALKAGVQREQITATYAAWGYCKREDKEIWGEFLG